MTHYLDHSETLNWFVNGVYSSIFCGPAAVIIFFIISGFCIHYPYKDNWKRSQAIPFLCARITRILGPILFATIIMHLLKVEISIFYTFIGWSIVCEIFYYSIYPLVRLFLIIFKHWKIFFILSFIPTLTSFFVFPIDLVNYPGVGLIYVLFLGLPCWLLGVILCYDIDFKKNKRFINKRKLNFCRIFTFFAAFLTHILALQEIIGHPFTLNFFAIIAYFWIKNEILYYKNKKINFVLFEKIGKASYSIYLIHTVPFILIKYSGIIIKNKFLDFFVYWLLLSTLTFLFFITVEKPFHKLSRNIKNRIENLGSQHTA